MEDLDSMLCSVDCCCGSTKVHHREQARGEQNRLERHCMIARFEHQMEGVREQSSSAEPGTTKAAGVPSILKDFARSCEGRRRRCGVGASGTLIRTSAPAAPLRPRGLAPRESEERANYRTPPTPARCCCWRGVLDGPRAGNQDFASTHRAPKAAPLPVA
jgi:hypothetical protein